jgi:5'-nucleotidase
LAVGGVLASPHAVPPRLPHSIVPPRRHRDLGVRAAAGGARTGLAAPASVSHPRDERRRRAGAGILALAQALQPLGEITIAAPAENQSGKGHSIVTSDPIFVDRVTLTGGLSAFSIVATPATCVKVGVRALMTERPDLVVSGINRGYNLGMVTYVSGTVGAAREAALMGIPAIASSLAAEETDYVPAAAMVRRIAEMVRQRGLDAGVLLNVNVPRGPAGSFKGIRVSRQSGLSGEERFEEQRSPAGRRMFWSIWKEPTGDAEGTDVWATEHGYVALTPLRASEFDLKTYDAWRARLTAQ